MLGWTAKGQGCLDDYYPHPVLQVGAWSCWWQQKWKYIHALPRGREFQRCLLWDWDFAPFFQWQNARYHVNVLYFSGMETFMFHMLCKQRKVPGYIAELPNLFHGMWGLQWLSPDLFWKRGWLTVFWRKPCGHHPVMMLLVGPVDQEADPGIPNPGKGAERLKPLWPIRRDLLIHMMSAEESILYRREDWFWYINHKKEIFTFVTCFDGLSCGSTFSFIENLVRWSLGSRRRMSLSIILEPRGSPPAQTPGTSAHSEPQASHHLHRCWANNCQYGETHALSCGRSKGKSASLTHSANRELRVLGPLPWCVGSRGVKKVTMDTSGCICLSYLYWTDCYRVFFPSLIMCMQCQLNNRNEN